MADSPGRRLRGWLGRRSASAGDAIVITPCRAVHTWFMQFPIDIVFMDTDGRVVRVVPGLGPFRHSSGGRDAVTAVEFPAGTVAEAGVRTGDHLALTA